MRYSQLHRDFTLITLVVLSACINQIYSHQIKKITTAAKLQNVRPS